jgi:hypothetical protein
MKVTDEELRSQGWGWAMDFPQAKKTIYIKFESQKEGFNVGIMEKGDFKRVPFHSVKHLFEEDRSPVA